VISINRIMKFIKWLEIREGIFDQQVIHKNIDEEFIHQLTLDFKTIPKMFLSKFFYSIKNSHEVEENKRMLRIKINVSGAREPDALVSNIEKRIANELKQRKEDAKDYAYGHGRFN